MILRLRIPLLRKVSLSRVSGVIITKKESFPKRRSPNMGLAGNDSLEKPPMLWSELDGGFSYLAFSVRRGNRLSVLLLFLLYLAYLLMASLLEKEIGSVYFFILQNIFRY